MRSSRVAKRNIALGILVPYLLIAAAAGFLHNHSALVTDVGQRPLVRASVPHASYSASQSRSDPAHRDACVACVWAQNSASGPAPAACLVTTQSVSRPAGLSYFHYAAGDIRLLPSRAPPIS